MIFTILFALRKDNRIEWSYWSVFSPIWFWKGMVILGATVGSYVWWRHPHARLEGEAYVHYKAMLITLALHLILLMFELLVCDKLESDRHLWILVFIPLIFISIVSIAVSMKLNNLKHDEMIKKTLFVSNTGMHMGCETRSFIWARIILLRERSSIYISRFKIGQIYNMELGSGICTSMGVVMFVAGRCIVRDCICGRPTKNTTNKRKTKADVSKLCFGLHFPCCTHFSISGKPYHTPIISSSQSNIIDFLRSRCY